jgi:hypothetical protein
MVRGLSGRVSVRGEGRSVVEGWGGLAGLGLAGVSRVRLMLVGCVLGLVVLVAVSGGLAGSGGSGSVALVRARGVGQRALIAGDQRRARAEAVRRRRWLESPVARRQRLVSQMAFHGLSAGGARGLLVRDFGSVVADASANPVASIARAGRVVRYLGENRAVVRSARGLELKTSSVPLLVAGGGGVERSVDLGLAARGGAFVAVRPLTAVSIARDSSGGATVGSDGLGMVLEGVRVPGSEVGGQSVFFGGVASDTDAVVAPRIDGTEFFAVLRSRLSPEVLRYRLSLPSGAVLQGAAGGAVVSRDGAILARVPAPSARDAQGVVMPVRMGVAGDELVLAVPHRSSEVAYPGIGRSPVYYDHQQQRRLDLYS